MWESKEVLVLLLCPIWVLFIAIMAWNGIEIFTVISAGVCLGLIALVALFLVGFLVGSLVFMLSSLLWGFMLEIKNILIVAWKQTK